MGTGGNRGRHDYLVEIHRHPLNAPVTVDQCPALFYVAYMYVMCYIMGKLQKREGKRVPKQFFGLWHFWYFGLK